MTSRRLELLRLAPREQGRLGRKENRIGVRIAADISIKYINEFVVLRNSEVGVEVMRYLASQC